MIDSSRWAGRPHPGKPTRPFPLTTEQRAELERLLSSTTTELRVARRAQALLLLADGVCVSDVAMLVGVHCSTVDDWKRRFSCKNPLDRLNDAPKPGRRISLFPTPTPPVSSQKPVDRRAK